KKNNDGTQPRTATPATPIPPVTPPTATEGPSPQTVSTVHGTVQEGWQWCMGTACMFVMTIAGIVLFRTY
ncbi:hypothetical protein, partial [Desulfoplanes sp.]